MSHAVVEAAPATLLLIDGHSLLYRAYHAFPPLTTPSGQPIQAVYGFTRILLTAFREREPEYVAVTFDHPLPTFRHEQFVDYKAHRPSMPDDLKSQVAIVKEVVTALGIPRFEEPGYEADDLIGTLATQAHDQSQFAGLKVLIMTGDRDSFQLVNDRIHILLPGRGKQGLHQEYDAKSVKANYGVFPEQVIDYKALMGDSSDNIPGVPGIGTKTAQQLLSEFGTLDAIMAAADEGNPKISAGVQKKLLAGKDSAALSKQLATINRQVPIALNLQHCQVSGYDKEVAAQKFSELGFTSLIELLPADAFEQGIQAALF